MNKWVKDMEDELEKKCSECGSSFICENDTTCWCFSSPKLSKEQITDGDCICKKCLLKKYKQKLFQTNEIKNDIFEDEQRYQWKNHH